MTSEKKPPDAPEESIPIRVICCLLAIIAIGCSFIFGKSPVPVIDFSPSDLAMFTGAIWMCVGGCMFSYHYRERLPDSVQILLKIAAISISLNMARELWLGNLQSQQFQFLYPLVDALTATSVVSCFELRTRKDILATSTFGLSLMALAGFSGRSIIFGACVLLYIALGALLLCLSARSYAETLPGADTRLASTTTGGRFLPALILSVLLLPCLSIAAFSFMPRADSTADSLSTQMRSLVTAFIFTHAVRHSSGTMLPESNPNLKAKRKWSHHGQPPPEKPEANPKELTKPIKLPELPPVTLPKPKPKPEPEPTPTATKRQPIPENLHGAQKKNGTTDSGTTAGHSGEPKPSPSKTGGKTGGNTAASAANGTSSAPKPPSTPAITAPAARDPIKPVQPAANPKTGNAPPTASKPGTGNVRPAASKAGTKAVKPEKQQAGKPASKIPAKPGTPAAPPILQMVPMPNGVRIPFSETNSSVSVDKPLLPSNEVLFTLACNRQMYVTVGYYDEFDGRTWRRHQPSDALAFEATVRGVDLSTCPSLQISPAMPTVELTENFKIVKEIGSPVPIAGIPKQISLLKTLSVDEFGNVSVQEPLPPGTSYSAICDCPVFSLEQLRQSRSFADGNDNYIAPYLTLPKNQSDRVLDLANELCDGGANRFVEAEKVVSYLRKTYSYTVQPVQAEEGKNLVDQFLFDSDSGDCKAFASSFVVLCRAAGIPARFVTGFLPGDIDPVTGAACIKRKHGHAWAEIFMEPYGWIPFDPTPGGLLPARPEQKYYNYTQVRRSVGEWQGHPFVQGLESVLQYSGYALALLAAGLGLTALAMSGGVLRELWNNIAASLKYKHPAVKVRHRVMARLKKIGVRRQPSDTGKDVVAKLAAILNENPHIDLEKEENLTRSVDEFFQTYNAIVYGNEDEIATLKSLALSIELQSKLKK